MRAIASCVNKSRAAVPAARVAGFPLKVPECEEISSRIGFLVAVPFLNNYRLKAVGFCATESRK